MDSKQEIEHSNYLLEVYCALFHKKYNTKPVFEDSNPQFDQIKTFKRMGAERSAAILEHYFGIEDQWFINNAYSIPCLIKNFNRVSASLGKWGKGNGMEGVKWMQVGLYCDSCDDHYLIIVKKEYSFEQLSLCTPCWNGFGHLLIPFDWDNLQKHKKGLVNDTNAKRNNREASRGHVTGSRRDAGHTKIQ